MGDIGGVLGGDSIHALLNTMQATFSNRGTPQTWTEHTAGLISFGADIVVSDDLIVVADARIDNAAELNERFSHKHLAPQDADLQLIANAYHLWGKDCPRYLMGDFAFAVYDRQTQTCFLARDPLGIKPLYYVQRDDWLIFSTEAQTLLCHPSVSDTVDEVMLGRYLLFQFGDEERSFFRDIETLPPAHSLWFPQTQKSRYWDVDPEKHITYRTDEEYAEHLLDIFTQVISDRLQGAEEAAILLSGGLDSGSVASVASNLTNLHAYSFMFEHLTECDEREYIEVMRDTVNIHYVPLEDYWLLGDKAAYKPRRDTPLMAFDSGTHRILADMQQRGLKILLTGHGGDNLMVGSPLIYADKLRYLQRSLVGDIRAHGLKTILNYGLKPLIPTWLLQAKRQIQGVQRYPEWIRHDFLKRLPEINTESPPFDSLAHKAMYRSIIDLATVRRSVHWHTWIGRGYDVSTQHPFLDRRVVEFVMAIPPEKVYGSGEGKHLLRQAMQGILPEKIWMRRDKTTFDRFFEYSLLEKERSHVRELMTNPLLAKMGIIGEDELGITYNNGKLNTSVNNQVNYFWSFLTLERWLREYYN